MQKLEEYTSRHFRTEDELMRSWPVDASTRANQLKAHKTFAELIARANTLVVTRPVEVADLLEAFLAQWLFHLIMGANARTAREIGAPQSGGAAPDQVPGASTEDDRLIDSISLPHNNLVQRTLDVLESSEKNEVLLKYASDGIHILDENGFLLETSYRFCAMLGYTCEEMQGMHVSEWDVTKSAEELRGLLAQQISSAEPLRIETRHRRKDGTILDVEIYGSTVQIQGKWVVFDSARDITERKTMEKVLQQSLERQRQLTDFNVLLGEVSLARNLPLVCIAFKSRTILKTKGRRSAN